MTPKSQFLDKPSNDEPARTAIMFTERLKGSLRRNSKARRVYANMFFLTHALREGLWRAFFRFSRKSEKLAMQQVITWDVPFPRLESPAELMTWLRAHDIKLHEGRHAIYLPPQEALTDLIPSVVGFYPPNSGFKILKDFLSPAEANYLNGNPLFVRTMLVGTPQEQLVTANYMYSLGLGPRAWDVCCWRTDSISHTVFVVDHVIGETPSKEQCAEFLERLGRVLANHHLRILLPKWEQNAEYQCPHCNHNLVHSSEHGVTMYVDFQNFGMTAPSAWAEEIASEARNTFHFGGGRPLRSTNYLYQSIPKITSSGKRNTSKRWVFLDEVMRQAGLDVHGRVVIDVGCNAGMMLYSSLRAGAAWGLGWDLPKVADRARNLLFSLGASRFNLVGVKLNPAYPLERDIPSNLSAALEEAVVFYLSIRGHVGLLQSLQKIPWRIFVYEGHQGESREDIPRILEPLLTRDVACVGVSDIADGDCAARPVAVLVRK